MGRTKFRVIVMSAVLVTAAASPVLAGGVSADAAPDVSAAAAAPVLPTEPGGTWGEAQYLTGISSGESSDIKSVSCTSPGNCGAVGYQSTYTTVQPVVVDETNGAWGTAQEIPGIASLETGGNSQADGGISCAAAGNCAAGGYYLTKSDQTVAFVVDESNGTWGQAHDVTGVASPGSSAYSDVSSISCAAAGNCTAVGDYFPNSQSPFLGFIVSETDGTWGPAQVIPGLASLDNSNATTANDTKVVCSAVGYCTITGVTSDGEAGGAFVVSETAGSWGNAEAVPGLAALRATGGANMMALSCSSAGSCAAGGYYISATNADVGFVVDETDGTWGNAQAVPGLVALATGLRAFVTAISCPSAGNCAATGYFWITGDTGVEPFVANETGGTWGSAQVIPGSVAIFPPNGPNASGYAISCVAPGDCSAGGNFVIDDVSGVGFVANETDGVWGTAQPVLQDDSFPFGVESLSCTAPGYCSAGGDGGWVMNEGTATATQVTVSTTNLAYGNEQAETLSATVTSPAGGTPTGTVTVAAAGATACTMTLTAGSGTCTPPATSIPAGSDDLVATYNGDTNYTVSVSAPSPVTVTKATSAASLTLSTPSVIYGQENTEDLTARVAPQFGGTPTGTVKVTDGTTTLCTITLTSGQGSCTPSATSLPAGVRHLTATHGGDTNYAGSSSALTALTVTRATSKTSLALGKATITYGQETTEHLTVTVTPQFSGTPTGEVTIKAGTTICTLTLSTAGKGTCTLTARQLKAGTYTLIAAYGGSENFHSSTSASKTLKVLG